MNLLEKNLNALSELKEIFNKAKNLLYEVEKSKTGELTLKLNNVYLHSKYDPIKEAQRIIDMLLLDKEELDVIILYGTGLGYVAKMLYERILKDKTSEDLPYILYIEADIKLFLTSLQYYDWSDIYQNDHFKIFLESDKSIIGDFLHNIPTKRLRYYYHRPSYLLYQEYYKDVQNFITYILDRKDMNTATFKKFQRLWTKNFIYNLPVYINTNPVYKLKDIADKSFAVVIAAGPTLEKCINYIKRIKEDAVLIAVETVYKFLKRNDIIPDIIVTVDPQFWNYKYLENEIIDKSIIVTDSSVYHKTLDLANSNRYFIGSSIFPIANFFEQDNIKRGTLLAGGSVATSAFEVARLIGCSKIILIGLDLSYPSRLTHFRGAFFETNFLTFSNYYSTAEHYSFEYLTHANLKTIESTNGYVVTDQKMYLFKKWFDREIPLTNAEVFLPDLGGVKLESSIILPLQKLPVPIKLSKKLYTKNINNILKNEIKPNYNNVIIKTNIIIDKIVEIKDICKKILYLIPENGEIELNNQLLVNNLESKLFEDPTRADVTRVISSSAQDILLSIKENVEYNSDKRISAWIKTHYLYKSIIDLTDFYKKKFNKLLKLLKK